MTYSLSYFDNSAHSVVGLDTVASSIPVMSSSGVPSFVNLTWSASSRPTSTTTTGAAIGSNYSGLGEVDFWNSVNGDRGYQWHQKTGASTSVLLAGMYGSGVYSEMYLKDNASGASGFVFMNASEFSFYTASAIPLTFYTGLTLALTLSTSQEATFASHVNVRGGSNSQAVSVKSLTELTTIAAAATTDTVIQIPANAIAIGVSVRVTTVIPTAATFDVGIAGATTRYGTGLAVAAGTTNPGTNDSLRFYAAGTAIRITPNLTPAANTGRVRVTIHYLQITPPTG